jgi:hypothetical protein
MGCCEVRFLCVATQVQDWRWHGGGWVLRIRFVFRVTVMYLQIWQEVLWLYAANLSRAVDVGDGHMHAKSMFTF